MTNNKDLFKELSTLKVWVGDGKFIIMNGKGTATISTNRCTKLIFDVLYVPEIDQNLLSVGQLVEKGYKVFFENKSSLIKNGGEKDILRDTSSCNSILIKE